jgi:hypothetical protein
MASENRNMFESEEFLVQINADRLLYAEKSEVVFDFRNIAKMRIHRKKADAKVYKITYRVKGQLLPFQIDGFADSDMQSIAALLKARASEFSISITDPSGP